MMLLRGYAFLKQRKSRFYKIDAKLFLRLRCMPTFNFYLLTFLFAYQ